ncbi:MAG TPA: hypothetical protein VHE55_13225 [Fimbriimonadaceae bacterium]|nr:hypothetical protein [Fimbriimonadaceae bacterium]
MGWLQGIMLVYGIFDIAMGLVGTLASENHEIFSLLGGGIAGLLVIGFAALTKTNPRVGFIGATVVALAVAGKFASKTFSGQIYPSGIIFAVSLLFAATLVGAHFAAVSRRKKSESS